ncbi:hypothetical protein CO204_02120 [Streptococcus mutans]|uniref:SMEK domain-containing protein n=1 Tax=Streptococcus mutans TaxID=1309 RepID=UPI0004661E4C|nr:SMEK domain-containing protein [Streptococcus mutans]AVM70926.1 hypothetical protein CO204_02120 [Streptococcus mutans]
MDCWRRNGRKVLFETSDNINQFIRTLRDLNEIIEKRAKLNLLDNAVLAESFYKEILNALFSWKLENLNIEQSNFEAIDLIDDKNKIVVQISCTCENQKVHSTISKDELTKKDYKEYVLYFVFIGKQNSKIKNGKYNNTSQMNFNPKKNIFLTEDLIKKFQDLTPNSQRKVLDIIQNYLSNEKSGENILSKREISERILEILDENSEIFFKYGPHSKVASTSPMSESSYKIWNKQKQKIIENNKDILNLYSKHQSFFSRKEKLLFNKFKSNVESFECNDKQRLDSNVYESFPEDFPKMLESIIKNQGVNLNG